MAENLREVILTSPSGQHMIDRVSPIYDDSYIGLWMFQAIGLDYDKLWDIVRTLPDQLFPETVTWAIELWEERYGITPNPSLSIEERRRKITQKRHQFGSITPEAIIRLAANITGLTATVDEYAGPYTFEVLLPYFSDGDAEFRRTMKQVKPSHMTCEINYRLATDFELYRGCGTLSSARIGILLPNEDVSVEEEIAEVVLFPANNAEIVLAPEYADTQEQVEIASAAMLSSNIAAVSFTVI